MLWWICSKGDNSWCVWTPYKSDKQLTLSSQIKENKPRPSEWLQMLVCYLPKSPWTIRSGLWCYKLQFVSASLSVPANNKCSHWHNHSPNTSSCRWKSPCVMSPCTPLLQKQDPSGAPLCSVITSQLGGFLWGFPQRGKKKLKKIIKEGPVFVLRLLICILCECALYESDRWEQKLEAHKREKERV